MFADDDARSFQSERLCPCGIAGCGDAWSLSLGLWVEGLVLSSGGLFSFQSPALQTGGKGSSDDVPVGALKPKSS
jgi:hypothetical protein